MLKERIGNVFKIAIAADAEGYHIHSVNITRYDTVSDAEIARAIGTVWSHLLLISLAVQ